MRLESTSHTGDTDRQEQSVAVAGSGLNVMLLMQ